MARAPSSTDSEVKVDKYIGTSYDNVVVVSKSLDKINSVAEEVVPNVPTLLQAGPNAAASATSAGESATSAGESLASKEAAALSEAATALDRIATGEDRVQTGLDRVATGADLVKTTADRAQTDLDKIATGEDRVATGLDRAATNADVLATDADKNATSADRTAVGIDRAAVAADLLATNADVVSTNADAASTAQDVIDTAASETAAAASENASETAETTTLGYLNDFKTRYYGPLSSNPTLDPLGGPIEKGDCYFNTTSNVLLYWDGTVWTQSVYFSTSNLADQDVAAFNSTSGQWENATLASLGVPMEGADSDPLPLGTADKGTSNQWMRKDAVISDQLPGTTVLGDGATGTTQAADDDTTKLATTAQSKLAAQNIIENTIVNGVTNKVTSQDALFDALALKANLDSPAFINSPTAPTPATADESEKIATTNYVLAKILAKLAELNIYSFEGTLDCTTNPNFPAANAGHVLVVPVGGAGKIGGVAGADVEAGDTLLCIVDASASGDFATVGANWVIGQTNLNPALFALLSGADFTGKVSISENTTQLELSHDGLSFATIGVDAAGKMNINTVGTLVGFGNKSLTDIDAITANTITAALIGNASTATKLAATKNINGVAFDGSIDITVPAAAGTLTGAALPAAVTGSGLESGSATTFAAGGVTLSGGDVAGRASSATYADLAEKYSIAVGWEPGQIVSRSFGEFELESTQDAMCPNVFGIISYRPAYLMNEAIQGAPITMVGRTPILVMGPVRKWDCIIPAGNGYGQAVKRSVAIKGNYKIVGEALENNSSTAVKKVNCFARVR